MSTSTRLPFPCVLGDDKDFQDREDSTGRAVYAMEGLVQGMYCESMVSRIGFQESVRKEKPRKDHRKLKWGLTTKILEYWYKDLSYVCTLRSTGDWLCDHSAKTELG